MDREEKPVGTAGDVVDQIFALPFHAQLGVLRTIAPQIVGCLEPEQREGFMRDLSREIEIVARGGAPYDVRPDHPSHERVGGEEQPGA
jgi:hypothetical protein